MNHQQLVLELADQLKLSEERTQELLNATVAHIAIALTEGKTVHLQDFGDFEVRKRNERLVVHPTTKKRTLIPPKFTCSFKQSTALKATLNNQAEK